MLASRNRCILGSAVVVMATTMSACASTSGTDAGTVADQYTGPQVTLLVTNGSCQGGHCDSIDVRLFPQHELETPAGFWSVSLGIVTGAQACLTVPMSEIQRVIGPVTKVTTNPDGTESYAVGDHPDTTIAEWTPKLAASLGGGPPFSLIQDRAPSTDEFVAATAPGWSVTLPGGQPVAGGRCTD